MCWLNLAGIHCSSHGKPWQRSISIAWRKWTPIGCLSRLSLLIAVCQPAYHGHHFLRNMDSCMVPVSPSTDAATQRPMFSLSVAQSHHVEQLSQQTSSKASMYRSIKIGYACEPYIQQTSNRHLRRILAQFRTGSHWLNIETGRHRKQDRKDRTCPMCTHRIINPGLPPEEFDAFDSDEECSDPIEDEHHAIFDCSAYTDAREQYHDLFQIHITTVGDFLNQPQCNRLANFLTWIRMLRMNRA